MHAFPAKVGTLSALRPSDSSLLLCKASFMGKGSSSLLLPYFPAYDIIKSCSDLTNNALDCSVQGLRINARSRP